MSEYRYAGNVYPMSSERLEEVPCECRQLCISQIMFTVARVRNSDFHAGGIIRRPSYSSEPAMPRSECDTPPLRRFKGLENIPCLQSKRLIPGAAGPSGRRFESGRRRSNTSGLRSYAGPLGESGISCSVGRSTDDEQSRTAAGSEVVPGLNNSDMSQTVATSEQIQIRYKF